jgi:hypothetical protein
LSDQHASRLQEAARKADQRLEGYRLMKEEMTALRATAVSPDRSVTVVAGPGGSILGVEFRPEAQRMPLQALSTAVMAAVQAAVADSARQSAELVQRYAGDQIDIVARVNKVQEEVFGVQPVEQAPPPPPAPEGTFLRYEHPPARPPMPPPPQQAQPPQPPRPPMPPQVQPPRRRPAPGDDFDEGHGPFLR